MQTVSEARQMAAVLVAALDRTLGLVLRPIAGLFPRRLRRLAERIEAQKTGPIGQVAAVGFLLVSILYGLVAGGQIGRLADSVLVFAGFGIDDIQIAGQHETADLAILEKLEVAGSLMAFDVDAAQQRVATLPWVAHASVRKFFPSTLAVKLEERRPAALWQRDGEVVVIDGHGTEIVGMDDARFASLPLTVGEGANKVAQQFLDDVQAEPAIAAQMRAAVLVAERRWDLYLEGGITVKLPERDIRDALGQLVRLDAEKQLLSRDVVVVDLRLPDRVTVRLPEGRSLEDVTSGKSTAVAQAARTRT